MRTSLCFAALLACAPALARADAPTPTASSFRHSTHLALEADGARLECVTCHPTSAAQGWITARPGQADHAPCDGCHAREYYEEPGAYCRVCHLSVDPTRKGSSPLLPYPRRRPDAQLIARFDHRTHRQACDSCHRLEAPGSAYIAIPRHQDCVGCHESQSAPRMEDCASCHDREAHGWARAFVANDIHFTHAQHQRSRDGQPVPCQRCHGEVGESARVKTPEMRVCVVCHDDAAQAPDRVRIARCTVCHIDGDVASGAVPANHTAAYGVGASSRAGAGTAVVEAPRAMPRPITPAWRLPSLLSSVTPLLTLPLEAALAQNALLPSPARTATTARAPSGAVEAALLPRGSITHLPEDHTPLFRRRHGDAASDPNAKCQFCHQGVSGSSRDACSDCHATMRPRSHGLRFQGPRHGRLAADTPDACATCHEVDYCTACHQIAPPSHFPLAAFTRNHTQRARTNTRSCLTCHSFEATCERCHDVSAVPRRGAP